MEVCCEQDDLLIKPQTQTFIDNQPALKHVFKVLLLVGFIVDRPLLGKRSNDLTLQCLDIHGSSSVMKLLTFTM
ncbi:hypothetical protein D3C81_2082070 [compost metagenome]